MFTVGSFSDSFVR